MTSYTPGFHKAYEQIADSYVKARERFLAERAAREEARRAP